MLETVTGYLQTALKIRQTGSAVSPLLWLNGIVTVPCILLSAALSPPMNFVSFSLASAIVLFTLWQYTVLRKINPRLLQSEKLQYEMAKLDLVASKGGSVLFDTANVDFGTEPISLPGVAEDEEVEQ